MYGFKYFIKGKIFEVCKNVEKLIVLFYKMVVSNKA